MKIILERWLVIVLLVFCVPVSALEGEIPASILNLLKQNWYCVSLSDRQDISGICVIRGEVTFAWHTLDRNGNVSLLKYQPSIGLEPAHLTLSPNKKMIALVYADEGHPVIVVHDIDSVLAGKEDKLFRAGVYPGGLSQKCWRGKNIIVESDQDLTGDWHSTEPEVSGGGLFNINPISHKITRVDNNICGQK